jgi:dephospho-CoA kinase
MRQFKNLKLLAFVGLPGSGVSTAVDYLKSKHYPSVYFGGVVLDAMRQANIDDTPENEQTFREQLRRDHGADVVVQRIIPEINNLAHSGQHRIILDGLYSWTEYKTLKHEYPGQIIVVSLIAPRHVRHRRLAHRSQRPLTEAQADERDWSEIEQLEKGGPIAIADYYITNDTSPEQFQANIDRLLHQIEF